jgi:hypothetical protein
MSRDSKDLIVGLDIGTSKIVALVAEVTPEGRLNVIGMGSQESKGLKKGVVVNIEETVATISRVLQEVELMADCKVRDVYTGIAGSHIRSFNSNGMVAIKDKEVTPDLLMFVTSARAPMDKPSRPMCEASVSAASRMAARVCWPLCIARTPAAPVRLRGRGGTATVTTMYWNETNDRSILQNPGGSCTRRAVIF